MTGYRELGIAARKSLQFPLAPAVVRAPDGRDAEATIPWDPRPPAPVPFCGIVQPRRLRLWDLSTELHCSIIGTCLTLGELRAFARKADLCADPAADDHHLHNLVVFTAGHDAHVAKLLHKALDRKFAATLRHYGRLRTADAVGEMWREDLARGEIPSAFWAVMTHGHTDQELRYQVYADVHMLSHLVGASNRAGIRRLRALEQENAALQERLTEQRRHAAATLVARDREIADLRSRLEAAPAHAGGPHLGGDQSEILDNPLDALSRQLARETRRLERTERLAAERAAALELVNADLQAAVKEAADARAACESLERRLEAWFNHQSDEDGLVGDSRRTGALANRRLLFVGGKPHQIHRLRQMVAAAGGIFLHHDGGLEENVNLLAGQVAAAEAVLFPVDCISHDAAVRVKRLCRSDGKPFLPLRTFSLAAVSRTLDHMAETMAP